jgi:hypothetical protein
MAFILNVRGALGSFFFINRYSATCLSIPIVAIYCITRIIRSNYTNEIQYIFLIGAIRVIRG